MSDAVELDLDRPHLLAVSSLPIDFTGGAEIALHELLAEARKAGIAVAHYSPEAPAGVTHSVLGVPTLGLDTMQQLSVAVLLVNRGNPLDPVATRFTSMAKLRGIPLYQWMHDFMDKPIQGARVFAASRAHALVSGIGAGDVLTPMGVEAMEMPAREARPALLGPQVFVPSNAIGKGGDTAIAIAAWVDGYREGRAAGAGRGPVRREFVEALGTASLPDEVTLDPQAPAFWLGGAGGVPWQTATKPRNTISFARMGSAWGQQAFRELLTQFDLALVPTRVETFCRTIPECFEAGMPVVASAIPVIVDEFGGAAVLVHPEAPPSVWWRTCQAVLSESAADRDRRISRGRAVATVLRERAWTQRQALFAEWISHVGGGAA